MDPALLLILAGSLAFVVAIGWIVRIKTLKLVQPGQVLIVNTLGSDQPEVAFSSARIIPFRQDYHYMDVKPKPVECKLEGLECSDGKRFDLATTFVVRVGASKSDILKVAMAIGYDRASDPVVLVQLFNARFSEALTSAASEMDLAAIQADHQAYRDLVIKRMKPDLFGYQLDDLKIDSVQPHLAPSQEFQTKLQSLGLQNE